MKRIIVDWHTKDGYYCGNFEITYEKRIPNEKAIKNRILKAHPHIQKPIEIEILK